MKKIEIAAGVHSSVLGFGCAPVLGAWDAKTSERAIRAALELGINHFDLARSYGYGEAERFVGKILRERRSEVVIATKFGLESTALARMLGPVKPIIRALRNRSGRCSGQNAGKPGGFGGRFIRRRPLSGDFMRRSLEVSLRRLRVDYVDIYMMHEPPVSSMHSDDLVDMGETLKSDGKIRAWGPAFYWDSITDSAVLNHFDFLQFNNSIEAAHYSEVKKLRAAKANIFFSPMVAGRASDSLRVLSSDFPSSVILCSMSKVSHIESNISALS